VNRRDAAGPIASAFGAITWRAVLATQGLGALFALTPWLEQMGRGTQPPLGVGLMLQSATAFFVMCAALCGDQLVRRGWSVPRAFVVMLLCASGATAVSVWLIGEAAGPPHATQDPRSVLVSFFNVGSYWGVALMVYLNRQSATRLLAGVRRTELERVQAERRLIASDLAAVEAQIAPAEVFRQLESVRDSYEAGNPAADAQLDVLIASLRDKVARCAQAS